MLKIQSLVKRYHYNQATKTLFNAFNITVPKKTFCVITGPSGIGKSTLLSIIAGFEPFDSGQVLWDSQPKNIQTDPAWFASNVGCLFQKPMLLDDCTIAENSVLTAIIAGKQPDVMNIELLLARLGLSGYSSYRPSQLSGGEQQRVALARVLSKKPLLILADEPTSNLDSKSAQIVIDALKEAAAEGACVIVASHDEQVIQAADMLVNLVAS